MKKRQRGLTLIVIMFFMFSMLSAAGAIVWLIANHARHARHVYYRAKAYYLAEAGMRWGYWRLMNNDWNVETTGFENITWGAIEPGITLPAPFNSYLGGTAQQAYDSANPYFMIVEDWKWEFDLVPTVPADALHQKYIYVRLFKLDTSGSPPPSAYAISAKVDY